MMKTKGTDIGKVGGNSPAGGLIGDTSRSRPTGQMPSVGALPSQPQSYMLLTPDAQVAGTQETSTLPMFSAASGYTDTGVGHSGDMGGAGA